MRSRALMEKKKKKKIKNAALHEHVQVMPLIKGFIEHKYLPIFWMDGIIQEITRCIIYDPKKWKIYEKNEDTSQIWLNLYQPRVHPQESQMKVSSSRMQMGIVSP